MNILGIFILLIFCIRPGEACPSVKDGNCTACDTADVCTDVNCDDGWLNSDNDATNGCETSNSTSIGYCATTLPSSITNCGIETDFTVLPSSFYSLQGQTPKLCYCTSVSTIERYIIGENDKCFNGEPQYRDQIAIGEEKIICTVNQYVNNNACVGCPAGTTNAAGGHDASGTNTTCDATICTVNQYVNNNACVGCPAGTTNAAGGHDASGANTTCDATICAADQRVVDNVCVGCPAGTTNAADDDASDANTNCDITNGTCITRSDNVCTMVICDTGYYRSADNSRCIQCEAGYQCSCDICDTREACPSGTFQSLAGQTSCDNVEAGHYATGVAQTTQTECTPGTFQAQTGQTSCKQCQKGYCPQGATEPLACLAGNYITDGRKACVACAAGKFQSRSGRMECDDCLTKTIRKVSVGEYQDQTGQSSCKACIGTVSTNLQSCTAKCKVGNRQHICPILLQDAATAVKYKDDLENQLCGGSTCTHGDCCDKITHAEQTERNTKVQAEKTATVTRMTNLFTFVVQAREKIDNATIDDATTVTNKKTELEAELRIEDAATGQTREDAIGNALTAMNTALNTKMNEKLVKSMEESDEERATERVELKRESLVVQMQERRAQAIDLSALNIKAAKDAVKETLREVEQEEEAAEQDQTSNQHARRQAAADAKVTAKAAQRQLAVASSNVKKMVFESMKTAATAIASASTDDLSVIVATKDVALNPDLDEKMEKFKIEFMKLKMAKDHSTITHEYDWNNFDCINADLNLDEMGLYDLDEVIFDQDEKAVACNLGDPVTYVEKTTDKADDYNDYEVYCCGESSGAGRLRRQLTGGLSCNKKYKDANDAYVKWNELDTYTCAATGDYEHLVMSLGGTFTGCFLESNGTVGWVYDSPGRTLGNCGASQCTVNNTNVTCLYLNEVCQPSCEAGYESDGASLTCTGGDIYSSPEPTCTGCIAGKYSSTGATCTTCSSGEGAVALSSQCHNCAAGQYVASTTGCATCPSGKYVNNTGQLECHNVTQSNTNFVTLLGNTGVECQYGGSPVYSADGAYLEGCHSSGIVMFGRAVIDDGNGGCANKCVKWYGTAAGNNLIDGFVDPIESGSTVIELEGDENTWYCSYLWGSTFNVPRSANC